MNIICLEISFKQAGLEDDCQRGANLPLVEDIPPGPNAGLQLLVHRIPRSVGSCSIPRSVGSFSIRDGEGNDILPFPLSDCDFEWGWILGILLVSFLRWGSSW